jgi:hypothetical protein
MAGRVDRRSGFQATRRGGPVPTFDRPTGIDPEIAYATVPQQLAPSRSQHDSVGLKIELLPVA